MGALFSIAALISAAVALGCEDLYNAIAPVACDIVVEVPLCIMLMKTHCCSMSYWSKQYSYHDGSLNRLYNRLPLQYG